MAKKAFATGALSQTGPSPRSLDFRLLGPQFAPPDFHFWLGLQGRSHRSGWSGFNRTTFRPIGDIFLFQSEDRNLRL